VVEQHFLDESYKLGQILASIDTTVVYGGACTGCMGAVADGALACDGKVIGVFPSEILKEAERMHTGITELILTKDMFERKTIMFERSEAFVITPGGLGTMDEVFEIITLKCLGENDKPILFYNYQNYFAPMQDLIEHFVTHKFASSKVLDSYRFLNSMEELMAELYDADIEGLKQTFKSLALS
jgi:uncharacterized protein (TIGR00730 family)